MAHIKLYILNCIFSYKIYFNNEYIFSAFSNSNILNKGAYVSFNFTFYFHRNITVELFLYQPSSKVDKLCLHILLFTFTVRR